MGIDPKTSVNFAQEHLSIELALGASYCIMLWFFYRSYFHALVYDFSPDGDCDIIIGSFSDYVAVLLLHVNYIIMFHS